MSIKEPKVIVDATAEPLTLDECRLHLRVDPLELDSDGVGTHPDDDLILMLLTAARQHCEQVTGMSLATKTLELALDEFPDDDDGAIQLPFGPVNEIVSVTVGTDSDALMDPADYVLDDFSVPNRLLPADSWPSVTASLNTIRIVYVAGFDGTTSSDGPELPKTIVQAIKLLMADWYKHREDTDVDEKNIPNGVNTLLNLHKIRLGLA